MGSEKLHGNSLSNNLHDHYKENEETGCWEWTRSKDGGYGQFHRCGTKWAHRVYYRWAHGKIPDDRVVDHMCMNRSCVNPDHLRIVDWRTNTTDNSGSFAAVNRAKTHCPQGHEYNEENTIRSKAGWRQCRICTYASNRRRRLKRLAQKKEAGG